MGERAGSSEERLAYLETLVNALGGIVWEFDWSTGCFTYVSEAAERLLGYAREDWYRPGFWVDHLHPDDATWAPGFCMAATTERRDHEFEYRMIHRNGSVRWIRDIVSVDAERGMEGALRGILIDVTEHRRADEALTAKVQEFDDVFRVMGDLYFRLDANDTVLDYKAPSRDALYTDPAAFLGRRITDVLPPGLSELAAENLALARETDTMVVTEYSLPTGGVDRHWEARFLPLGGGQVVVVSRDVTERSEMEARVSEAEERYRLLVDTSPYAILVLWLDETVVFANAAAEALLGATSEHPAVGANMSTITLDDASEPEIVREAERLKAAMRTYHAGDEPPLSPLRRRRIRTLDGRERTIERLGVGIEFRGEPAVLVMARDVTTEIQAEAAVRAAERRFKSVVDHAPFGVHLYDMTGGELVLVGANQAADDLLGVITANRVGLPIEDAFPGLRDTQIPDEYRRIAVQGGTWSTDQVEYHEGTIQGAFAVTAFRVSPGGVAVMFQDVTAKRQAEESERRYAERLSAMAAELTVAEDSERRRLAEELHDRVSQALAVARMHLSSAESFAAGAQHDELLKASFLVESAIAETRAITTELAPPVLYELGLGAALRWQCDDLEGMLGITTHLRGDADEQGVNDEAKMVLFRAARELLANVAKHSGTKEAWIDLDSDDEWLSMTVADRGVGFEVRPDGRSSGDSGFGLFSIRDRLPHLGGVFELETARGEGTRVTLRVPRRA